MATLTAQNIGSGGAYTLAAATGGGDSVAGGPSAGGWDSSFVIANVGTTATTITIDGVAYGPYTSQTAIVPVRRYNGAPVAITYSQVTNVTVGLVHLGGALTGITYGT